MADNRKYYYLKLKENFFDSDSIVLLEDMKDGILYSNILLKLYLKSLKNGGRLQLDEHMKFCFTDWLHDLQDTLLHNPIKHSRNPQRTEFPVGFRNIYPSYSFGLIVEYFIPNPFYNGFFRHLLQIFKGYTVNASRVAPLVCFQVAVCQFDVLFTGNDADKVFEYLTVFAVLKQLVLNFHHAVILRIAQAVSLQHFFSSHSQHHLAFGSVRFLLVILEPMNVNYITLLHFFCRIAPAPTRGCCSIPITGTSSLVPPLSQRLK